MINLFRFGLSWVGGVIIAAFVMSLWKNGNLDWEHIIVTIIGGLTGILIVFGIQKVFKKGKN